MNITFGAYITLGIIALFFLILIGRRIVRYTRRPELYELNKEGIKSRWEEIERLLNQPGEMSMKLALLEADKLLGHVLKSMAMPGETLAERLKFASYKYPNLRKVWWAHKLRNRLAHEAAYHLDSGLAKKAVKEFKKALETVGVL